MGKQSLFAMEQDRLSSSEAVGTRRSKDVPNKGAGGFLASMFFRVGWCQTHLGHNLLSSVCVGLAL